LSEFLYFWALKYKLEERSEVKLELLTHLTPTDADWREGYSFEDTFPELQELTENIQSTPIADLEKHFKNLSETFGKQVAVVGVKLPLSTLNKWGQLILLGMQLYFFLHLQHFSRTTKGKDNTLLSFPWIGLYRGALAKFVLIMTGMVLPVWVIYLSSKGKLIPFDLHGELYVWQQDSVLGAVKLSIAAALAIGAAYYAGKVQIKSEG